MFRSFRTSALVALLALGMPLPAAAVTYKFDFQMSVDSLNLSPLNGSVTVDFGNFDFSKDAYDQTTGVTGSVDAPYGDLQLGWTYVYQSDALFLGGMPNTVRVPMAGTNDFWIRVSHFNRKTPFVNEGRFTRVGYTEVHSQTAQSLSISVIPLPANVWLLLGGLGALGLLRRRRPSAA
jgi:hypothetical protein